MSDDSQERRVQMCAAALNAILDANHLPDGSIVVDPAETRDALHMALAAILEAWPDLNTPRDIRQACEAAGKDLHTKVKLMRDQFERTGRRPWDGALVRTN